MIRFRTDFQKELFIASSVAILLLFGTKFMLINMPAYWDEMGIYVEPLKRLFDDFGYLAHLRGFHDHPPGLHLLAYPLYKISGASMWSVRVFALLMSSFTLVMTYLIARKLSHKFYAITGVLLLFLLPTFFSQSIFLIGDNTVTGILLLYFYFAILERWKWALMIGLLVGICRETSLAYGVGIFVFFLVQRKLTFKVIITSASPAISLGAFFLLQKIFYGETFQHQAFTAGHFAFRGFFRNIINIVSSSLGGSYFFYLWVILVAGLLLSSFVMFRKKEKRFKQWHYIAAFIAIIATYVIALGFDSGFLNRYLSPVFPLIMLIILYPWALILKKSLLIFVGILAFIFIPQYYGKEYHPGDGHVDNMQYVDVAKVYSEAASYLEEEHRGKRIFAPWPLNHVLQSPYMGYVTIAFKVECQQPFGKNYDNHGDFDLFVWASNSDVFVVDFKDRFVAHKKLILIKSFDINNKKVEIYKR